MTEPDALLEPLPQGILHFPEGLPGFENLRQFVLLRDEDLGPLYFLTAVAEVHICLPVVPVGCVQKDYSLALSEEDRRILELAEAPRPGDNVAILAVVNLGDGSQAATANLFAPIVVNLEKWKAKQVILYDSDYPLALEV